MPKDKGEDSESGSDESDDEIPKRKRKFEPVKSDRGEGIEKKKVKPNKDENSSDDEEDSNFSDKVDESNSDSEAGDGGGDGRSSSEKDQESVDSDEKDEKEVVKTSGSQSRGHSSLKRSAGEEEDDEDSDSDFEHQLKANPIKVNPVWQFEVKDLKKAIKAVRKGMPTTMAAKLYGMSAQVIKKQADAYPKKRKTKLPKKEN